MHDGESVIRYLSRVMRSIFHRAFIPWKVQLIPLGSVINGKPYFSVNLVKFSG
jgi:hypothetical protein